LTGLYFDSAYIGKCYVNEDDAHVVRALAASAGSVTSSALCIAEVACAFHRKLREGFLTVLGAQAIRQFFLDDIEKEVWMLVPVSERILRKVEGMTGRLPKATPLRAGDAIHLASAVEAGFDEIWTNDRHLLAAAKHFGLKGRSV
jgi:predicted nucleic acid-binding protein